MKLAFITVNNSNGAQCATTAKANGPLLMTLIHTLMVSAPNETLHRAISNELESSKMAGLLLEKILQTFPTTQKDMFPSSVNLLIQSIPTVAKYPYNRVLKIVSTSSSQMMTNIPSSTTSTHQEISLTDFESGEPVHCTQAPFSCPLFSTQSSPYIHINISRAACFQCLLTILRLFTCIYLNFLSFITPSLHLYVLPFLQVTMKLSEYVKEMNWAYVTLLFDAAMQSANLLLATLSAA